MTDINNQEQEALIKLRKVLSDNPESVNTEYGETEISEEIEEISETEELINDDIIEAPETSITNDAFGGSF